MSLEHKPDLPVTIIGGYLGSGKTTLVNHLLRNASGLRIAVLVNDFGELPIDRDLIEAEDGDILSIAGGCVCCSYGNDLIAAMVKMAELEPRPDHVVLETSGVAIPGAIAASLGLLDKIRLVGTIVMADAETVADRAGDTYVGDTILRQLSDASIIVANKVDLLDPAELKERLHWLREVNRNADIVAAEHGKLPLPDIMEASQESVPDGQRTEHDDKVFGSFVAKFQNRVDAVRLAEMLSGAELDLIRTKGFVLDMDGDMRLIQTVLRRAQIDRAPEGAKTGIVCIGVRNNLDRVKSRLKQLSPDVVIHN